MSEKLLRSAKTATQFREMGVLHCQNNGNTGLNGVRKIYHNHIAKGQKLVASFLAAIAINRVYAVAQELDAEEVDPLANLRRVDDLSGIGELCIPGLTNVSTYEKSHDHDSVSPQYATIEHGSHSSRHGDSYASRYANKYARNHDSHEERGHGNHGRIEDHPEHQNPSPHQSHSTHQGHTGHLGHASHQIGSAGRHDRHDDGMRDGHGSHLAKGGGHEAHSNSDSGHPNYVSHGGNHVSQGMSAHQHTAHSSGYFSEHSDREPDEGHDHRTGDNAKVVAVADENGIVEDGPDELHDDHQEMAEITEVEVDELTLALQEITLEEEAVAQSHDEHHAHGATLAMMDLPPAEDLAAMTVPVL